MSRSAVILFLSLVVHAASARDLSIQDVAARPKHFNGRRISVIGYFKAAHEECCLYTSRRAASRVSPTADLKSGHIFWIDFLSRANEVVLNNHFGRFTGIFRYRAIPKGEFMSGFGQWGLFSSKLEVTSYESVP